MAHRRGLPDQDERGWARSVEHAAGAHVAARLMRLPAEERWALLRVLIGLGKPAPGLLAGERAGLLSLNAGEPVLTAVARGPQRRRRPGAAVGGLEEALPEDLRAALMPAVVESSVSNQFLPTPSAVEVRWSSTPPTGVD
ncbi:MAG: hypothetical protein IPN01_36120 [Deltaproteobacteria bacterium]|nr:hypothetical protein [Deltaproteobacteria bacterium]